MFVGSQATNYGEDLTRKHDELWRAIVVQRLGLYFSTGGGGGGVLTVGDTRIKGAFTDPFLNTHNFTAIHFSMQSHSHTVYVNRWYWWCYTHIHTHTSRWSACLTHCVSGHHWRGCHCWSTAVYVQDRQMWDDDTAVFISTSAVNGNDMFYLVTRSESRCSLSHKSKRVGG